MLVVAATSLLTSSTTAENRAVLEETDVGVINIRPSWGEENPFTDVEPTTTAMAKQALFSFIFKVCTFVLMSRRLTFITSSHSDRHLGYVQGEEVTITSMIFASSTTPTQGASFFDCLWLWSLNKILEDRDERATRESAGFDSCVFPN
jgi:hypothetical protein